MITVHVLQANTPEDVRSELLAQLDDWRADREIKRQTVRSANASVALKAQITTLEALIDLWTNVRIEPKVTAPAEETV